MKFCTWSWRRACGGIVRVLAGAVVLVLPSAPGSAQGMGMTIGPGMSMGPGGMSMGPGMGPDMVMGMGPGMMLGMGGMSMGPPATTKGVVFIATGEPSAMFEARCIFFGPGWQENVDLAGRVPYIREFPATGINCSVSVKGGVMIEVQRQGSHMAWQARDGTISISMS